MGQAKHARRTKVFVNGDDLSAYLNSVDTDSSCPMLDSTAFGDADKTYEPGTPDGKVSLKGLWYAKPGASDPLDRDAIDDILHAAIGDETANLVVTVCQEGADAAGLAATLFETKLQKYSVTAPHDQLVSCMAEMQADGGLRYGQLLAPLAARAVSGNGAAADLGAATTRGFEANLHCTARGSAGDTLAVTIEDSADGATGWATIGTFAALTNQGRARLEIAGSVRRYVRAKWTITGDGGESFTFVVAFALKTF
jgi:hypothetical protein